jgi:predicted ATPase
MTSTEKKSVRRYDVVDKIISQIESYFALRDQVNNLKKERKEKVLAELQEDSAEQETIITDVRDAYHARIVKLAAQSNGPMKTIKHEIKILRMEKGPVDNTLPIEELREPV